MPPDAKPPVSVGDTVRMTVTGYGHDGEGVGRIQEYTLFAAGALRGEEIEAEVTEVRQNFGRTRLIRVLKPSPDRQDPPCPIYERCGGCQLLHLAYPAQLELKRQRVVDAMVRLGGMPGVTVHPAIGMDEPWHYRNKVQYPLGAVDGRLVVGCYEQRTHQIVPTETCLIQQEVNNRLMQAVRDLAQEWGLTAYDETTGRGFLRHVLIKNALETGQAMVALVTNGRDFPRGAEFGAALAARVPELKSLVQNVNLVKTNIILGPQTRVLWGADAIIDRVGDLQFRVSATSFFQVNPLQTETLYETAVRYAGLTGRETALDAYCGVGSLTLFLARKVRKVYGVEVSGDAIDDAGENARLNGIKNVEFVMGESEKVLPKLAAIGIRFDVAVLDPPRAGCGQKVLQTLAKVGAGRIVYVSCNPSTLARDLRILRDLGYETKEVQPVDMFPHTYHVECAARVERMA
ncbi:MAG: 23S rRNA (uracil(1939)-C(5))-methyltransferase RlmD [Patescibacteria group bacterium]